MNVFWHYLHLYNIPLWTDSMCILRIILVSAGMIFVLTHHQRSSFLIRNIHTNLFSSLFYDNSCNTNEFTYLYWYVSLLRTKWWNCWYYSIIDLHNFDKCSITAPSHYDKYKSREFPKIGVCNPMWEVMNMLKASYSCIVIYTSGTLSSVVSWKLEIIEAV